MNQCLVQRLAASPAGRRVQKASSHTPTAGRLAGLPYWYTSNGRYGGGSGVCEYSFGPVTFECGPNASQKQVRGAQNHPKARPETTQKAPKVNSVVPRSKEAGSAAFRAPHYTQKALK